MEVVPAAVGAASRAWDDQNLALQAAAGQVAALPVVGFTSAVVIGAARFVLAWEAMLTAVAAACETEADALRLAIRDYVLSDDTAFDRSWLVATYLNEVR